MHEHIVTGVKTTGLYSSGLITSEKCKDKNSVYKCILFPKGQCTMSEKVG